MVDKIINDFTKQYAAFLWLRAKLYYTKLDKLLKPSTENSAFIGHVRLLSVDCTTLCDPSSASLQKSVATRATSESEYKICECYSDSSERSK
jgi:hypothetical protein